MAMDIQSVPRAAKLMKTIGQRLSFYPWSMAKAS
jgi:hypothetical protein